MAPRLSIPTMGLFLSKYLGDLGTVVDKVKPPDQVGLSPRWIAGTKEMIWGDGTTRVTLSVSDCIWS